MAKAKKSDLKGAAPKRVLVVEDDAILALALEDELRAIGVADVEICHSTEDALRALRAEKPDVLVLDVHLADRNDGWAIAELVDHIGPKPPRIIFSTGAPGDIPEAIAQLGAIMEKPYDPTQLAPLLLEPKRVGIISRLRASLN